MTNRLFIQILILTILLSANFVGVTFASLSDSEHTNDNTFTAGSVDFELRDSSDVVRTSPLFNITGMIPGESETKTVKVKKEGSLDFQYSVKISNTGGDSNLCDTLKIEAKRESVSKYNDRLSDLDKNPAATIDGDQDEWEFIVKLDSDNADLRDKTCTFDLVFKGWQIGSDGTWGLSDTETLTSSITTGTWDVPISPLRMMATESTIEEPSSDELDKNENKEISETEVETTIVEEKILEEEGEEPPEDIKEETVEESAETEEEEEEATEDEIEENQETGSERGGEFK